MRGRAVIEGLKYAKSHEWAKLEGDVATVGISDHAQVRAAPRWAQMSRRWEIRQDEVDRRASWETWCT